MFRALFLSCLIQAALVPMAIGAGPYGTIRVGEQADSAKR
jgi:hypothetical protein